MYKRQNINILTSIAVENKANPGSAADDLDRGLSDVSYTTTRHVYLGVKYIGSTANDLDRDLDRDVLL